MDPKYYFTTMARKPMTLSGRVITFTVSSLSGGRAAGVFKATEPADILVLDDAVRGRRGVSEITQADYEAAEKKKSQTRSSVNSAGFQPRVVQMPTLPDLPLNRAKGALSADDAKKVAQSQENLFTGETHTQPTIASLLRVKRLNPPKPFAEADGKTDRAIKRADRAKVRVARKAEGQ